jgi:hypothetical protein
MGLLLPLFLANSAFHHWSAAKHSSQRFDRIPRNLL